MIKDRNAHLLFNINTPTTNKTINDNLDKPTEWICQFCVAKNAVNNVFCEQCFVETRIIILNLQNIFQKKYIYHMQLDQ